MVRVWHGRLFWAVSPLPGVAMAGRWWVHAGTPAAPLVAGLVGVTVGAGAVLALRSAPDPAADLLAWVRLAAAAPAGALRQGLGGVRARVGGAAAAWVEPGTEGAPACVDLVGTPFTGWRDALRRFAQEVSAGSDAVHVRVLAGQDAGSGAQTVQTAAGVAAGTGVLVVCWPGAVAPGARRRRLLRGGAARLAVAAAARGPAAALARGARGERARLARALHDGPAQVLTYLKLKAETGLASRAGGRPEPERMEQALAAVRQEAGVAIDDLRATIAGLRLQESLVPRLEEVVAGFRRQTGIACTLLLPSDAPPLAGEAAGHVLGIVQEALANVRKHARARHAWVRFTDGPRGLTASVADDGQGFDAGGGAAATRHFGLEMLRERATALGGTVTVRPRRGGGTEVLLEWPGGDHGDESVSAS